MAEEEPEIVISEEDARDGVNVKGMTTVLVVSIIAAVIGLTLVAIFVSQRLSLQ